MLESSNQLKFDGILVNVIRKRIKHSYLRIGEDGVVIMTVNHRLSESQINTILARHLPKLKDKVLQLEARHATKSQVMTHISYLGESISINQLGLEQDNSLPLDTDILLAWYKGQAKKIFAERFEFGMKRIISWNVTKPRLSVKTMKTRWGSYSKSTHKVSLSLWLIKMPIELIDYVIAHELTHIIHYNHSNDFYSLLATLCPDWKEQRNSLRLLALNSINSPF